MTPPGHALVSRKIINGLVSPSLQVQLFGVDLTLERVLTWTSAGTVDLDNSHRQPVSTKEIPFTKIKSSSSSSGGKDDDNDDDDDHQAVI
ncbi:dUTPase [Trichophyton violaceum]|uniref:dUTPase n=1 Tax=Trichophyton violaceum TaxID=34388 RepID=A0A178FFA4_TRIVO|nr:dUTPase [Trichophyton violaceum]